MLICNIYYHGRSVSKGNMKMKIKINYRESGGINMRSRTVICVGLLVAAMAFIPLMAYAVPNLISYQGVLNDSGGAPVNATVSMTFTIYNAPTGGSNLWNETQSVQVSNGIFNVQLGSVAPLNSSVFATDTLYLGIKVGADSEMTPRQQITTGSYSYKAALVEQTIVPVGAIMAWTKSLAGVPALPDGWVECNGQTLNDTESPLNGQVIPNLNGENRFLKGNSTSGTTGGVDNNNHFHNLHAYGTINKGQYGNDVGINRYLKDFHLAGANSIMVESTNLDNKPPFYNVVWIMRVK